MGGPATLYSVLADATAPDGSDRYQPGQRLQLVVLVQGVELDQVIAAARRAIADAGWQSPDFHEVKQLPGKMTLAKLRALNRTPGVAAAIRHGKAVIVFPET
jgi:hypothetical protein